jgi:hypothetical protein
MSIHYLRLLREEVKTKNLVPIPRQRLEHILNIYRRMLLEANGLDRFEQGINKQIMEKVTGDIELLAITRFIKALSMKSDDQASIDNDVLKTLLRLLEVEKMILSPALVVFNEKYLFRFTKECGVGKRNFRPGELAFLEVKDLLIAVITECGELFIHPAWRDAIKQKPSS